jgi:hypothetical protein
MVNRNVLIGKVSPFLNKRAIIESNQDTTDIIDALIKNHYKYASEYDKVYRYFDGGSVDETAFNVWQFLKDDFKYTIEPEKMQILRSPAAILASNMVGIDCKGYATWAAGVMDAYRRNSGKDFEVYYRFASYDPNDKTPQHVFCVVKINGTELWIDPVLDQFDEKKQPYYYKDKKIKNMALVAMSGIGRHIGDDSSFDPSNIDFSSSDQISTGDSFLNMQPDVSTSVDTSTPSFDQYGNLNNYTGGATYSSDTSSTSTTDWFSSILKSAPSIITALNPNAPKTNQGSYITPSVGTGVKTPTSTGISTNTIFLIGAAGLAAYFLLKKK